jgi:HlyD family secretion protein
VQVGSQVSGTIKSLHADFNSLARKGQVKAQVDQAAATVARLQADIERARVALEDAQVN